MTLIVHELGLDTTPTYQELKPTKNTIVKAIRPHILKYGNPSGSLQVRIADTTGATIATSESVSIDDISDATYFHGFIKFEVDAYLREDTTYRIYIEGISGYSFSESAYCGVCKEFENKKYQANYPNNDFNSALDIEIWEKKEQ
jgi:hypothetical protein